MTDTTARKPLTSTTWATVAQVNRDSRLGWADESDLAHELTGRSHLTIEQTRTLVSAAVNGLPVVLTWDAPFVDPVDDSVERRTVVGVLNHLRPQGASGLVHVEYWGFGHDVWLSRIVDVRTPDVTVQYRRGEV